MLKKINFRKVGFGIILTLLTLLLSAGTVLATSAVVLGSEKQRITQNQEHIKEIKDKDIGELKKGIKKNGKKIVKVEKESAITKTKIDKTEKSIERIERMQKTILDKILEGK